MGRISSCFPMPGMPEARTPRARLCIENRGTSGLYQSEPISHTLIRDGGEVTTAAFGEAAPQGCEFVRELAGQLMVVKPVLDGAPLALPFLSHAQTDVSRQAFRMQSSRQRMHLIFQCVRHLPSTLAPNRETFQPCSLKTRQQTTRTSQTEIRNLENITRIY